MLHGLTVPVACSPCLRGARNTGRTRPPTSVTRREPFIRRAEPRRATVHRRAMPPATRATATADSGSVPALAIITTVRDKG